MKRVISGLVTLVIVLTLLVLPAQAATVLEVRGGWLRLREAPNYGAKTLASFNTGTRVTEIQSLGEWSYVQAPGGLSGYMVRKYLAVPGTTSGSATGGMYNGGASSNATVTSQNGLGVRLRSGPSISFQVLGLYPVGTSVRVMARGASWSFVRIGKTNGYMMNRFLSTGSAPVPVPTPQSGSYLAYVTSQNGLGVRLRSGAGMGYSVLGVYSVGTEVTVLQHGRTWDQVRIGSRTGYMMNRFLTTNAFSNQIASVTLNTLTPGIGTVLQPSVQPGGATVSYRWTDQYNVQLGTHSTYTVSSADAGRRIRVTVIGYGLYTGSAVSPLTSAVVNGATLTAVSISNTHPAVGEAVYAMLTPSGAQADFWWYRGDGSYIGSGPSYTPKASDVGQRISVVARGKNGTTGEVYSSYTAPVVNSAPPAEVLTGSISIPSHADEGTFISPSVSLSSDDVDYLWYYNGAATGDVGLNFVIPEGSAGGTYQLYAIPTASSGITGHVKSNKLTVNAAAPTETPLSGSLYIAGSALIGNTLTADISGLNSPQVTYQWYADGAAIVGATDSSLYLSDDLDGMEIKLKVSAAGEGFTGSVTSTNRPVVIQP